MVDLMSPTTEEGPGTVVTGTGVVTPVIPVAAAPATSAVRAAASLHAKLALLADAAKYDASCASSGTTRRDSRAGGPGSAGGMGICHSYAPDGRCILLLKVLLTNFCELDCKFCINRSSSNVPRLHPPEDDPGCRSGAGARSRALRGPAVDQLELPRERSLAALAPQKSARRIERAMGDIGTQIADNRDARRHYRSAHRRR